LTVTLLIRISRLSGVRQRGASSHDFLGIHAKGNSIGIITTFDFQTQPAPASIINWSYKIPTASPNEAAAAFSHIQSFALNASVIDGLSGFGVTPTASSFNISGTYRGDNDTFTNKVPYNY